MLLTTYFMRPTAVEYSGEATRSESPPRPAGLATITDNPNISSASKSIQGSKLVQPVRITPPDKNDFFPDLSNS